MNAARPSFIEADVPFGERTSLAVGGNAAWGAAVNSTDMLDETLRWARSQRLPWRIFGEGSNTLVSDNGYDGVLIEWTPSKISFTEKERVVDVHADAGANWDRAVRAAVEQNAAGIECLSGIPGTVGAAPIQNIGAYGQELSDVAMHVEVWDTLLCSVQTISAQSCAFRYRNSRFKSEDAGRFIVIGVALQLELGGPPSLAYRDLRERFAKYDRTPTLGEVREAVLDIRRTKSMVLDENDPESRSAGSFFMNPILDAAELDKVSRIARDAKIADEVPSYAMSDGRRKVPAAWLIERSGIIRGFTLRYAHVSKKHTLALVADEHATTADIVSLARHVRTTVSDTWGVELSPEPGFVGFDQTTQDLLASR